MPNRIIRAGINRSERVNQLDAAEEIFYRRLLNEVDDHGLFDARPAILRASLFPLRLDRVREADISRWTAACRKAGLLVLYVVNEASGQRRFAECDYAGAVRLAPGDKPYLQVLNTQWKARSEPKYPLPPVLPPGACDQPETPASGCGQLQTIASNCEQTQTDENNCEQLQADVGNSPQLRPYSETNTETETRANAREDAPLSPFAVYRSVYGAETPIYHQEAIEAADIDDLDLWRESVAGWKANRYSTRNISGLIDSYRQRKDRQTKQRQAEKEREEPSWRPPLVVAPEGWGRKPQTGGAG